MKGLRGSLGKGRIDKVFMRGDKKVKKAIWMAFILLTANASAQTKTIYCTRIKCFGQPVYRAEKCKPELGFHISVGKWGEPITVHRETACCYYTYDKQHPQIRSICIPKSHFSTERPSQVIKELKVVPERLNVRIGPGVAYRKIHSLSCYQTVYLIGEIEGWAKIIFGGNVWDEEYKDFDSTLTGWVSSKFIGSLEEARQSKLERIKKSQKNVEVVRALRRKPSVEAKDNRGLAACGVCGSFGIIFLGFFGLVFYFLPTIFGRKKKNVSAIFALNLLLGWTLIGWIVALI